MNANRMAGKKVLVMGLGRFGGGVDAVRFAAAGGARVTVTDMARAEQLSDSIEQLAGLSAIEYHLGAHEPRDFDQADVVIANPAVPPDHELLQRARRNGAVVTSQIGLFFQLCPAAIIGITGANGKSTTTALTAHILNHSPARKRTPRYAVVWMAGNIGNRPLLTTLERIKTDDLVVLELSSFQLEQLAEIPAAPDVALLTNLTPNHLDRHGTFEAYCAAKEHIFAHQKPRDGRPAVSIFNAEDEVGRRWCRKYAGQSGRICITFSADRIGQELRSVFGLPGRANLSNLAAAVAVARRFGLDDETIAETLPTFRALPHRLELIGRVAGVRWYNDSIATTPQSAIAALEAFDQPSILIAGGYDKNLPFDELGRIIVRRAKAVVLLGQTAGKIADAIATAGFQRNPVPVHFAQSLAEAVSLAADLATFGDVVLLSPACASYDMFDNFQQRGRQFVRLVQDLGA